MADVTSFLDEAGLDFDVLEHAHTERAADEAAALGVSPTEVAKTLVLTTPEGNVRAVLPASERIDLRKVGDLVGASRKKVHLATEDDLARDYAEFELGAARTDDAALTEQLVRLGRTALELGGWVRDGQHVSCSAAAVFWHPPRMRRCRRPSAR